MVAGIVQVIKDWGVDPKNNKHKWSVKLDTSETWFSTTNKEFSQIHSKGDSVRLEASEFPEGSSRYWFHRFGGKATSQEQGQQPSQGYPAQPQPQSAPQPAPQPPQATNGDLHRYQPLVSNLAAHLITAGKEPGELVSWFEVCRDTLEGRSVSDDGPAPVGDYDDLDNLPY